MPDQPLATDHPDSKRGPEALGPGSLPELRLIEREPPDPQRGPSFSPSSRADVSGPIRKGTRSAKGGSAGVKARPLIAYYRVSTDHQGIDGNGIEGQREAVANYMAATGGNMIAEFTEVESGKRADRPEFAKALAATRKNRGTLVIAKLDRLSRSVHFISGLSEGGVPFVACDMPNANEFMINIYAAVAQEERKMISDRTKAGLAAARRRGVKLGNPDMARITGMAAIAKREGAHRFAKGALPAIRGIQGRGITSHRGIAAELDRMRVPTATKTAPWSGTMVARVLARAAT